MREANALSVVTASFTSPSFLYVLNMNGIHNVSGNYSSFCFLYCMCVAAAGCVCMFVCVSECVCVCGCVCSFLRFHLFLSMDLCGLN